MRLKPEQYWDSRCLKWIAWVAICFFTGEDHLLLNSFLSLQIIRAMLICLNNCQAKLGATINTLGWQVFMWMFLTWALRPHWCWGELWPWDWPRQPIRSLVRPSAPFALCAHPWKHVAGAPVPPDALCEDSGIHAWAEAAAAPSHFPGGVRQKRLGRGEIHLFQITAQATSGDSMAHGEKCNLLSSACMSSQTHVIGHGCCDWQDRESVSLPLREHRPILFSRDSWLWLVVASSGSDLAISERQGEPYLT